MNVISPFIFNESWRRIKNKILIQSAWKVKIDTGTI